MADKSTFAACAEIAQGLSALTKLDRCGGRGSLFGNMEILSHFCKEEHEKIGERWRNFGRYGNIVCFDPFDNALQRMKDEIGFTREEFQEQYEWLQGQVETYHHPDEVVAMVLLKHWLIKIDKASGW